MMRQQGITLIGAIFVLVIVSLLGKYLINIAGIQHQTSLLALQSARAYHAASAGIEWGNAKIINGGGSCQAEVTLTVNAFTTTVNCTKLGDYIEDLETLSLYQLTAQSEYGSYGDTDYISRKLEVTIHD